MFIIDSKENEVQKSAWAKYRGGEFQIAPTSSIAFQRAFSRLQAPHRKKIEKGTLDPQVSQEISCQALAETILLDWRGVGDSKGAEIPYTVEGGFNLMVKMPDLREFIQEFALDIENFRAEETKAMGK